MAHSVIYKRVAESSQFDMDFTDLLPTGDTLSATTSTVTATDSAGVNAPVVVGVVSVQSSTKLRTIVQGGADKEDYLLQYKGVGTPSGQSFVKVLEVRVRERIVGNV